MPAESEEEARTAPIVFSAIAAFLPLLYWAIVPRKYQILEDKLKIVLGGPFSFNIGFNTIREAKGAGGKKAIAHTGFNFGINFATSTKNVVEIWRSKKMKMSISPSNGQLFLEELNKGIANWKRSQGIK
ncbi:MAG TPA: PH domain-containing protein [Dehalococcoidia bacterium]|nr:PH domain-containing protein [Dehalococcoidia bacterium]